jgi:hypothetical protein
MNQGFKSGGVGGRGMDRRIQSDDTHLTEGYSTFSLVSAFKKLKEFSAKDMMGSGFKITISKLDNSEIIHFYTKDNGHQTAFKCLQNNLADTLQMRKLLATQELKDIESLLGDNHV